MKHAAAAKDTKDPYAMAHAPPVYPMYPPYPGFPPPVSGYMQRPGPPEAEAFRMPPNPNGGIPPRPVTDSGKDDDTHARGHQGRPQDNGGYRRMQLPGRAPAPNLTSRQDPRNAAAAGGGQIIRRKGGPMRGTHPAEINKQITGAKDVWVIVDIVLQHGTEFDAVNVATALHRMAKACPDDPTELLRSSGFEQLLMMVEAQVCKQPVALLAEQSCLFVCAYPPAVCCVHESASIFIQVQCAIMLKALHWLCNH